MRGNKINHILNHTKEAHILVNRQSREVAFINPAAKSIFGVAESVIKESPDTRFQCIDESERARVCSLFEKLIRHGTAFTAQYRVIRPNGTLIWVEEYSRIIDSDGTDYILSSLATSNVASFHREGDELKTLTEIGSKLSEATLWNDVANDVLAAVCGGLDWDLASIWLLDPDAVLLTQAHQWSGQPSPAGNDCFATELFLQPDCESGLCFAVRSGQALWVSDLEDSELPGDIRDLVNIDQKTCVCVPITQGGTIRGLLMLCSSEVRDAQGDSLQSLKLVASLIGQHLQRPTDQVSTFGNPVPGDSNVATSELPEIYADPVAGTVIALNKGARQLLRKDDADCIGRNLGEIVSKENPSESDLMHELELTQIGETREFSGSIKVSSGFSTNARFSLRRIDSTIDSVVALTITSPLAEIAHRNEARKDPSGLNLPQDLPCALALLDLDLRFVFASDRWLSKFGVLKNGLIGKAFSDILGASDSRWQEILNRVLKGEHVQLNEEEFTLSSGSREWISWSISPWKSPVGEMLGAVLYSRLVTSERRSRQSLKRAETKYRTLFDNMIDGFAYHRVILDADGEPEDYVFLEVNRAFERMTGLKRSEIVGRRVTEVLPQVRDDQRDWIAIYGQLAIKGGELRFEDYSSDLDRWYSVAAYCPKQHYFVVVMEDITKRKQAEAELIEAGRTISTLLGNLPGMAYRCLNDPTWQMEYVSDGVLDLTGYEAEELIGSAETSYAELIAKEDREYVWEEVQLALSQDRPFRISYRITTRDGVQKWVWEQGCGIKDDKDQLVALEGFITDVTERKRAEEALRSREEFYRELIDQSSDIFMIVDQDCNMVYVSTSVERVLAYAPEEIIQTNGFDYVHLEDVAAVRSHFQKVLDESAESAVTYRFKAASGAWRLLESKWRNLLDNPHVRGIVINSRDVTERSRVQLELMKLATAVDQAAEAIIITDTEGKIEYVNPAFEKMSGYDRASVFGQNPRILRSGENSPSTYREMWGRISSGEHWVGRITNRRHDGRDYQVEVAISPMKNADGEIVNFVAVQRDITKEKLLEDQLRQAQKLEAVGRLASGIAHDFNNLLAGIRGFAELISLDTSTETKIKSFANEIVTAAGRAADLTGQLLAFARQGNYLSVPVDLHTIISEVVSILSHTMEKNIKVETQFDAETSIIKGDPSQIQSAILNLAVNARDAMPQGGRLTIRSVNREVDSEFRHQHDLPTNRTNYVAVEVIDTGTGIPANQLEHIFEPFFTTKPQGEGTGLGLAGVYGCAKNHNGGVFVESELGAGSIFTLLLPSNEELEELDTVESRGNSSPERNRVVIVDDENEVLLAAERILVKAGYKVSCCTSGEELLQLLRQTNGIDLALIDVIMPGLAGQELFLQAREIQPDLCVLLMSGYSDSNLHKSLQAGVAGFLPKPFDAKNLMAKVREALAADSAARFSSIRIS